MYCKCTGRAQPESNSDKQSATQSAGETLRGMAPHGEGTPAIGFLSHGFSTSVDLVPTSGSTSCRGPWRSTRSWRSSRATRPAPGASGRPDSGCRGRGEPRLPAVAVPQPGGQPPPRPLRRLRRESAAVPAGRPGRGAGATDADTVVGLRISSTSRTRRACRPDRRSRLPVARLPGARRLPQRHDGDVGVAGRIGPHRAGDVDRQRVYRPARPSGPRAVGVPVLVGGRVNQPQEAERLLARGADAW